MTRPRSFRLCGWMCASALFFCFGVVLAACAQFETRATIGVAGQSSGLVLGDFNHDGKLDAAVTAGNSLSIFLGNGDGTFRASINYPGVYYSIAVADFNNDGNLDLVVAPYSNNIDVFLGKGDGTFQGPLSSLTTGPLGSLVVGDFNGDHRMDIAGVGNSYISVLLGNGDGTFQSSIDNSSFFAPGQLAVGDFNNDHKLDVAVVGSFGGSSNFGVLFGNGNGTLQGSFTYPLPTTPGSVAAADFRHDGKLDLAIGGYISGGAVVFLGNGDGTFQTGASYAGSGPILVQDFNGDGHLDIVAGVTLLLGDGDGAFREFPSAYGPQSGAVSDGLEAAGDLNGDALPDLVLLDSQHDKFTTMLNTGVISFYPTTAISFPAQLIGTVSRPKTVRLSNTGPVAIAVKLVKISGSFKEANTCGRSLKAGATCEFKVVFAPTKSGLQSGGIAITDGASSKPQYIELSGVGK